MLRYLYHYKKILSLCFALTLAFQVPAVITEAKGGKGGKGGKTRSAAKAKVGAEKPVRTPVIPPAKVAAPDKVTVLPPAPPNVQPTLNTALKTLPTGQGNALLTCPDPFAGYKRPLMSVGQGAAGGANGEKGAHAQNRNGPGGASAGGNDPAPDTSHLMSWDGCDQLSPLQAGGGRTDDTETGPASFGRCGPAELIDPQFLLHLQKTILPCANEATVAAGIGNAKAAFMNHMGIFSQRRIGGSGSWSQHSYGRAIDLASLVIKTDKYPNGYKMSAHIQAYKDPTNKKMYDTFAQCFSKKTMEVTKGCGGEGRGVITHEACEIGLYKNADHANHFHLSLDRCAGAPYEVPTS